MAEEIAKSILCPTCRGYGDEMNSSCTGFHVCRRCNGAKVIPNPAAVKDVEEEEDEFEQGPFGQSFPQ